MVAYFGCISAWGCQLDLRTTMNRLYLSKGVKCRTQLRADTTSYLRAVILAVAVSAAWLGVEH